MFEKAIVKIVHKIQIDTFTFMKSSLLLFVHSHVITPHIKINIVIVPSSAAKKLESARFIPSFVRVPV